MGEDSDKLKTEESDNNTEQRRRSSIIEAPNKAKLRFYSISTFITLFMLYGTFHAVRTSWSYMKHQIAEEEGFGKWVLGTFDTTFLISYASGLYLSGYLGDRIELKLFLIGGTLIVFTGYMLFVLLGGVLSVPTVAILAAFVINGIGQSTGWPGCIHILSNWVDKKNRGFFIGLWAANLNIGDILGQQVGALVTEKTDLGWKYGYVIIGAILITCLLMLVFLVKARPDDLVKVDPKLKAKGSFQEQRQVLDSALEEHGRRASVHEKGIGFLDAWKIPGVLRFAFIYLCVKGTVYGCMFWLPDYLQNLGFKDATADLLAVFEIGQLIGVVALGYFTDVLNNRSIIVTCAMGVGSIFFLFVAFISDADDKGLLMVYLFFAGLCIGGPSGLISGAVATDLSSNNSLKGNVSAMSTVTGIIEGSGTVGGALVQMIVPQLGMYSFYFYFSTVFMAAALLAPVAYKDYQKKKNEETEKPELMVSLQQE